MPCGKSVSSSPPSSSSCTPLPLPSLWCPISFKVMPDPPPPARFAAAAKLSACCAVLTGIVHISRHVSASWVCFRCRAILVSSSSPCVHVVLSLLSLQLTPDKISLQTNAVDCPLTPRPASKAHVHSFNLSIEHLGRRCRQRSRFLIGCKCVVYLCLDSAYPLP